MSALNVKDCLALVSRPGRYIGGEVNSVKKDLSQARLKIAIAFPDVYEIGMSHLGIRILYHILNSRADIACERVFSPWVDMERLLRDKGEPLTTLESGIPLNKLDILGFSIQYELSYTNILNILNLGNIPLFSRERDDSHPIIIGGGPIAFNPEPIADFFDAFVLGDGEEAILEIADIMIWVKGQGSRVKKKIILERLSKVEGVYVPSFFDIKYNGDGTIKEIIPLLEDYKNVKKRIVADINTLPLPTKPVVPFPQIVHDHLTVEINRGCTRGCRFCQAGIIYRPNRERSPENIMKLLDEALKNTGYNEASLLSLSAGDHSCIQDIIIGFMERFADKRIALSLPSLRVGTLNPRLIEEIKRVKKTGFTLAPEAGSERLRRVINKGIEENALIETVGNAVAAGWRGIKLYFMMGLPTETMDDIRSITELSSRAMDAGKKSGFRPTVNVSVSQFIPKPHTPFQWEPQIRLGESLEIQSFLKKELQKRRLDFKWHDARMSFLEGVFSRGDRKLSKVIWSAFENGCRFDSWGEQLRFDIWENSFKDNGINPEFYTYRRRDRFEILPWEHLSTGVTKEFLHREYERSLKGEQTPDCKVERCSACGVCDHKAVKNIAFYSHGVKGQGSGVRGQEAKTPCPMPHAPSSKIRFTFSKTGDMKYLGHLELVALFSRAIMRGEIPIAYSSGFHPLPKVVFGQPLPVGIESISEEAEIELKDYMKPEDIQERLNKTLPVGIKILDAREVVLKVHSLSAISDATYLISMQSAAMNGHLQELINRFLERDEVVVSREKEGKKKSMNIRPLIKGLSLIDKNTIQMTLSRGESFGIKPFEVMESLLDIPPSSSRLFTILKTKGHYETLRK